MTHSDLPRVLVITTGGTISMTPSAQGIQPTLTAEALLAGVPGLAEIARIETLSPFTKPGASLDWDDLARVHAELGAAFARGCHGAVVVQGTDTLEETAFLLDLLHQGDQPIVVTGAMRGAGAASADGPANLANAILVAADVQAKARGVLVALNDEIHAAAYVQKADSTSLGAFASHLLGPIGRVVEGRPRWLAMPDRPFTRWPQPLPHPQRIEARVAILPASLGDDGSLLSQLPGLGYHGLVVQGMGVGHVPQRWVEPLAALARQMPVVLASRIPGGISVQRTYGFPGSERDLLERGLISAGLLDSYKARLLLAWLLSAGADRAGMCAAFDAWH